MSSVLASGEVAVSQRRFSLRMPPVDYVPGCKPLRGRTPGQDRVVA